MSWNDEVSSDEGRYFDDDEEEALSAEDRLFAALASDDADAAAVQRAIRDGANVNAVRDCVSPLMIACRYGCDQIVGILLDAGADILVHPYSDAWWKESAISEACKHGHLSTVQLLINYDNGLLEIADIDCYTPLLHAIDRQHPDIVRFLLDSGASPHHVECEGIPALMRAIERGNLEIVRLLMSAGADVEARDRSQQTALHWAAFSGRSEVVRELILQHNANMFAVDEDGRTPFDSAGRNPGFGNPAAVVHALLEMYGNTLTQDHGRLALHELLKVAEYSFAEDDVEDEDEELFHPPLNPLRIILPLGKLTLKHLRTLLHALDPELIRNRDDSGKLPIHIACRANAPVEVLALILELYTAALFIADSTGALPIHLLCGSTPSTDYASVRYLVEQGGAGTLAARNQQGLLPLHVLSGCTNPPLRVVQYLIQSFPGSVAVPTHAGEYPFMMAAAEADSSSAPLSVIYELVRTNPDVVVPR